MRIIGIVGEYNPFHLGHLAHIEESKKLVGGDCCVVCVMSGNFVQRGDAAIFNKHSRAHAAVRSGADIVFELPVPWAMSSAESFARGAVSLLGSLGVVSHLSFGSECGDMEKLSALAELLITPGIDELILQEMASGISYAAARQAAVQKEIGSMAELLEAPNNILAVEYLKAIYNMRLNIEPVTMRREGAMHDKPSKGAVRSASELRGMLESGRDIKGLVPAAAFEIYTRETQEGRGPVTMANLETAVLSRLRMLGDAAFSAAPDASEGLENRLSRAAWTEPSLEAVLSAAKTKRYTLARLRRMLLSVCIGITASSNVNTPPYARLLAAGEKGRGVLKMIAEKASVPVITKPASIKELDRDAKEVFALDCAAGDLYVLGYRAKEERRGGTDWRTSPIVY